MVFYVRRYTKTSQVYLLKMKEAEPGKRLRLLFPADTRFGTRFIMSRRSILCRVNVQQTFLDPQVTTWVAALSADRKQAHAEMEKFMMGSGARNAKAWENAKLFETLMESSWNREKRNRLSGRTQAYQDMEVTLYSNLHL
uniref:Uncharacterized protein n=1 Tax=Chromera velia CCMP2878 TaxID=1169474 RepID=A0A0G4HVW7_9ALVE|eukprot:Cvel_8906.t1-p1 / transcript=Cvel_8906.t1 / gene=Cvel_8906 / organism=Chromera_velia_CCMP2878 / gene_product=hypothetical protein / transcript_product=hypothetical protein / location=Cvel_scaffold501:62451-63043(-) / protein_length=139 / sequence_SO=supercontig / SO=protein_coding / is_pseudo=false